MILLRQHISALLILGTSWALPSQLHAQDGSQLPATVAAVIDYQRILRESAASKSIAKQMEGQRKAFQNEISKEEQRLHEAEKALAKQRSILSDDKFDEKQQEFEQQVSSVQDLAQDRRRQLEEISSEAVGEVQKALVEIVTGMAESKGFNIVLPSSQLLFFARQIDLTDEVLSKLDEKLPEVVVADRVD